VQPAPLRGEVGTRLGRALREPQAENGLSGELVEGKRVLVQRDDGRVSIGAARDYGAHIVPAVNCQNQPVHEAEALFDV